MNKKIDKQLLLYYQLIIKMSRYLQFAGSFIHKRNVLKITAFKIPNNQYELNIIHRNPYWKDPKKQTFSELHCEDSEYAMGRRYYDVSKFYTNSKEIKEDLSMMLVECPNADIWCKIIDKHKKDYADIDEHYSGML